MNSKRRYIYVDSSSGTATSSIPYQSPSPQEALPVRGRYGNNDCYTFPMTKPSSVGLSEACYAQRYAQRYYTNQIMPSNAQQ